jgi:hypothetical protein
MHGICYEDRGGKRMTATDDTLEDVMRKLALNVDMLRVESFATQEVEPARGTVRGHDDTVETENCTIDYGTCLLATCLTLKTCAREGDNDAAENR